MATTCAMRLFDRCSNGGPLNSPETTTLALRKQRSVVPELERAARVEFTGGLGRTLTDKEWTAVRTNLLAFVNILRAWDQRGRTNEHKGGKVAAPVESYPKAA